MWILLVAIKPCCDTEETKLKHGKLNCKIDEKYQHQWWSWSEKETQLQSMQLLNRYAQQPENSQADS